MNIKKTKNSMNFMPYILLAIVVICSYLFLNNIGTKVNNLDYTELITQINEGKVTEISVTPKSSAGVYVINGKIEGYAKGETFSVTVPYTDTVISSFSLTGYSGGGKKMIADYEASERNPLLDAPLTVSLTATVYDFRSLEDAKAEEVKK